MKSGSVVFVALAVFLCLVILLASGRSADGGGIPAAIRGFDHSAQPKHRHAYWIYPPPPIASAPIATADVVPQEGTAVEVVTSQGAPAVVPPVAETGAGDVKSFVDGVLAIAKPTPDASASSAPGLTIYSMPKSFERDITRNRQRNAIRSWTLLEPRPEIILFGDDPGVAEIAVEFGLKHVPIVEKNKNGTPFISDMMHQARSRAAPGNYLCMINADIILLQEFYDAYYATYEFFDGGPGGKGVSDERTWTEMLMIGCRYNLDLDHELNFAGDWVGDLKTHAKANGKRFTTWGIDYFLYSPNLWPKIPPFLIGRFAWDNYIITQANKDRKRNLVVDATDIVLDVHLNHDYGDKSMGAKPQQEAERRYNAMIGREDWHEGTTRNAHWVLHRCGPKGSDNSAVKPTVCNRNLRNQRKQCCLDKTHYADGLHTWIGANWP